MRDAEIVATTTLRFSLEAVELRQRVAEAIAVDAAMFLGPDKLRLLLGEPNDDREDRCRS